MPWPHDYRVTFVLVFLFGVANLISVVNNITFQPGGSATITTPSGNAIPASWTATGGQLCLRTGTASECFPYQQAFQAGQSVTATSSCGATSRWLASAVNQQQPPARAAGERG